MDVDSATCPKFNISVFRILGILPTAMCYAKTQRGWHVVYILPERLQSAELIALQCILGDDPMRGALNLMRIIQVRKSGKRLPKFWRQRHNILYAGKIE